MSEQPVPGAATVPIDVPRIPVRLGLVLTTMVGLLIAMAELSRLSGEAPDATGISWPFGTLLGPGASELGWLSGPAGDLGDAVSTWLGWYVLLDLGFIALYAALAFRVRRAALRVAGDVDARPRSRRAARAWRDAAVAVLILAGLDLVEDGLALVVGRPARMSGLVTPLVLVTRAKWLVALAVGVLIVRGWVRSMGVAGARDRAVAARLAVFSQRFSLVFLVPVVLLSLVPRSGIFDQLPDIERSWADGLWGQGVWSVGAIVVIACAIFVLGRLRSTYLYTRTPKEPPDRQPSRLWIWFGVGGFAVSCGLLVQAFGLGTVHWGTLAVFAGVPIVVAGASVLVRRVQRPGAPPGGRLRRWLRRFRAKPKPRVSVLACRWSSGTGDLAAVAVLVVGGLGAVRSFTAPVALMVFQENLTPWPVLALAIGIVVAVGAWPASAHVIGLIREGKSLGALLTPDDRTTLRPRSSGAVALVSVLALLGFATFPDWVDATGAVVATVLPIALIALALGFAAVLAQDRKPPEIFWAPIPGLHVKSAPVFSLLLAVIVVAGLQPASPDVHGVRGTGASTFAQVPARPTLDKAFDAWVTATNGCGRTVQEGARTFRVRVMPLLAAEGGGIRAAYWTSAGLDLLSGRATVDSATGALVPGTKDPCRAALFSGGASGGAVGLTVARFADATPAHEQVLAMTTSSALGKGALGMLVRDTVYSATGVPLPSTVGWQDRAALIEQAWTSEWRLPGAAETTEQAALSQPFLPNSAEEAAAAASTPPGFLMLNTTRVSNGCRVLLSQVQLQTFSGPQPAVVPCDKASRSDDTSAIANSLDYFAYFDDPAQPGCTGNLQAATAALMASRFPYVTPSGVVGPCPAGQLNQFVDGGYVENTGISTITDLAPDWLALVRAHNDASLASSATADLIVPMVVYFDNDTSGDLATLPPGTTMEGLVPITAIRRAEPALEAAPALLQRAADVTDSGQLWSASSPGAAVAREAVATARPLGVIVVNPSVSPAVAAPLGWAMSKQSVDSMDASLVGQVARRYDRGAANQSAGSASLVCARGYGSLADAIAAFGSGRP